MIRMNLIKEVEDLYTENCTTLMKEIKEHTNKSKKSHIQGLEDLLSKCTYYPN